MTCRLKVFVNCIFLKIFSSIYFIRKWIIFLFLIYYPTDFTILIFFVIMDIFIYFFRNIKLLLVFWKIVFNKGIFIFILLIMINCLYNLVINLFFFQLFWFSFRRRYISPGRYFFFTIGGLVGIVKLYLANEEVLFIYIINI